MNADTRDAAARTPNAGTENCLPIGTRLSDFEITGVLGEGGFGIVYVAYDHALQRTVAIKEYMPGVLALRAADQSVGLRSERHQETFRLGLKSFINEARFLAQFDHPALVKVYRFWEQNNTAYTAMKFYDGRTVKDIVANSPELVDEAWCRKVLRQILQALEMLHMTQIVHRDVSPDNIIVQENGDAVLLDFGSARQIIGDTTRGLTVILKPGYAPVEQYAGDASLEQGPYTDLYALSAVMYFAIAKAPPPTSIGRMVHDPMVALATQAPHGYGETLLAAIDEGLAVLAQDRPQTIVKFRALLGIESPEPQPARAMPAPVVTPFATPAPPSAPERPSVAAPFSGAATAPASQRRRLLIGGAAAGLLALAVAGLYTFVQSPNRDTVMVAQPQTRASAAAASAAGVAAVPAGAAGAASTAGMPASAAASAAASAPVMADADYVASAMAIDPATPPANATPDAATPPKPEVKHPAPPAGASYRLKIKPWGTVYVDGRPRGVSPPLKQLVLTHGKHTIRVVNPSFPEYMTTIEVDNNKPGAIEHEFSPARP
jgi:serine/threonine protein kinase